MLPMVRVQRVRAQRFGNATWQETGYVGAKGVAMEAAELPLSPRRRPRRTRQHVIADLSVNHVERVALMCGYSVERILHDYGYDLEIWTYDRDGRIENMPIKVQVKAVNSLRFLSGAMTIPVRLHRRHIDLWMGEPSPGILALYDAQSDHAYWLFVQAYFNSLQGFSMDRIGASLTVYLKQSSELNPDSMRAFAQYRDNALAQIQGVIRHYD